MTLPVIPLRDLVVFPSTMVPLYIGRDKSLNALTSAIENKSQVILLTQKNAKDTHPTADSLHRIGTICDVIQTVAFPDGTVKVMVEAKRVARVGSIQDLGLSIVAHDVEDVEFTSASPVEIKALIKTVKENMEEFAKLDKRISTEILAQVNISKTPEQLAYIIAANLNIRVDLKQEILEMDDGKVLLEKILSVILGELEIIRVEKKIQTRIKKQVEKSQKEYYLTEQMEAIQKELGGKDDYSSELDEMLEKAKKKSLSDEALTKITKEIKKLKMMSPMSAESTVIRNYIETLLSLPWKDYTQEERNIKAAQKILNRDHYGLDKVKERILEQLAVMQLNPKAKGSIICLVGPPGVGKTSLAKSIAEAQNRPFIRVSLGGVRDEAEIRGHRRTYVGAMPGKIINALKKADKGNPVILLDEIDKMSSDFKGDPASAMLEVLDPEQNHAFQDHYVEIDYDLSKVLFFATANYMENIPRPLLDRMEIIRLEGYTQTEKFNIARTYLIPKQLKEAGLDNIKVNVKDAAVNFVIEHYTREAGVRSLERTMAKLFRKIAKQAVLLNESKTRLKSFTIDKKQVVNLLGPERYKHTETNKTNEIGVTNGMAWTEVGGDLLPVEVAVMPGKGAMQITGKLGDVMTESAKAAMSYVRSRAVLFGIEPDYFQKHDVHVHVPDGATPKDGPSAGITLTTSLVSAILKIPVKRTIAMTGEVSLRGKVLPIGGLKEKIMAAQRGGVTHIICPKENEKDLKDIPKEILAKLDIACVEHVDEVLVRALDIKNPRDLFKVTNSKEYGVRSNYE